MKVIRTVTITPEVWEVATEAASQRCYGNFSRYVEECIRRDPEFQEAVKRTGVDIPERVQLRGQP